MAEPLSLLIVEDSASDAGLTIRHLERDGFAVTSARVDGGEALGAALRERAWDAVICDYEIPGFSVHEALRLVRAVDANIPFIVLSGVVREEEAATLMRSGASDYVMKGRIARLAPAVRREIAEARHRAEAGRVRDELAVVQRRHRIAIASSQEGYAALDEQRRFLEVNDALCAISGRTREELLGLRLTDLLVDPETGAVAAFPDCEDCPGQRRVEVGLRRPDGTVVEAELSLACYVDGAIETYLFAHDVTDRRRRESELRAALEKAEVARTALLNALEDQRRSEAALRESESRYRSLFDHNPHAMWVYDAETLAFLAVNDVAVRRYGYSRGEFLGMKVDDLLSPGGSERSPALLPERARDLVDDGILRHRGKDGAEFFVEVASCALQFGGRIARLVTATDIGERIEAEERIRKLSLAVEQSPEAIVITNLKSEIEYVNAAFVRSSGYEREEVIGRTPRLLQSGKTPASTYHAMWAALHRGVSWRGEFTNRRKDGSEYVEFAVITPIRRPDGQITHYVGVKEDITERKRLARELDQHRNHLERLVAERTIQLEEARTQAETANRAKSAFLANMSHEIRTPLNAIVGLAHLVRRSAVTPEQAGRLERIEGASRHLLSTISNILDLSKIEAGHMLLEQTDFQPRSILMDVQLMVSADAQAKGLSVEVELGTMPGWLRGDPVRLRQALLNFASNAVKFTERGGLTLRASLLGTQGESVTVRFEVTDTGIGVPEDKVGRIFHAFEQGDATITRRYGGSGLGLAITRLLAELMGGEVGVDSTPGRGSTFWFTARLAIGQASEPPSQPVTDAESHLRREHSGARLLLAEDNAINREVAVELIHSVGLEIDTAENGAQAVEMARDGNYDLILMDMQMPVMDGLAATRFLRATPGRERVPILAMTANAFEEDRRACEDAGMDGFVAKPVEPSALFDALAHWLDVGRHRNRGAVLPPAAAPGTAPNDEALERLRELPGFDTARGIAVLRGNARKYLDLVRQMADSAREAVAGVRDRLAAGRSDEASQLAHGLKGMAATLGATGLAAEAARLEAQLKAGEDCAAALAAVDGQLAAIARALARSPAG